MVASGSIAVMHLVNGMAVRRDHAVDPLATIGDHTATMLANSSNSHQLTRSKHLIVRDFSVGSREISQRRARDRSNAGTTQLD